MKHLSIVLVALSSFVFQIKNPSAIIGDPVKKSKKTFSSFIAEFETVSLPYTLDKDDLILKGDHLDRNFVSDTKKIGIEYKEFFPEVAHARFSRMGPNDYYFEAKLASTDEFILVMYSVKRPLGFAKEDFIMLTYTPEGKIIDQYYFANAYGLENIVMASIDGDLKLTRTEAQLKWEKDPYSCTLEENTLESVELKASTAAHISRKGKFINDSNPETPIEIKKLDKETTNA